MTPLLHTLVRFRVAQGLLLFSNALEIWANFAFHCKFYPKGEKKEPFNDTHASVWGQV